MVAEDPVRQHLSFSVDGIDMLYRGTDLLYTGAIYGMQDCFMYAWKDYIVVPTQFLRQDCFYPGIEKATAPWILAVVVRRYPLCPSLWFQGLIQV